MVEEKEIFGVKVKMDKKKCPLKKDIDCLLCLSMKCNRGMEVKMYCPCCREEFKSSEEVCFGCMLPLLDYKPRHKHTCRCQEGYSTGWTLVSQAKGGAEAYATASMMQLTEIKNPSKVSDYLNMIVELSEEELE